MIMTRPILLLAIFLLFHCRAFNLQIRPQATKRSSFVGVRFRTSAQYATTMEWQDLSPSCFDEPVIEGQLIAKDDKYLESVLQIWSQEEERSHSVETKAVQYYARDDRSNPLFGHLLRRKSRATDDDSSRDLQSLPAILLFHTAAGPQDVFLYYKADVLLQNLDCFVMICDIMSDADGWGWDPNRVRYNGVRQSLMEHGAQLLKARVLAAVETICEESPTVDIKRISAMGWCLGGQPILELAGLNAENPDFAVKAMITFHGVFARGTALVPKPNATENASTSRILICNGKEDPFVAPTDLAEATEYFRANGFEVETLQLEKAKHGFTNPAQDFNTNPAFGFSKEGAVLAWNKAMELLRSEVI
jgi:dienelactone hydrolase